MARRPIPGTLLAVLGTYAVLLVVFTLFALNYGTVAKKGSKASRSQNQTGLSSGQGGDTKTSNVPPNTSVHVRKASRRQIKRSESNGLVASPHKVQEHISIRFPKIDEEREGNSQEELLEDGDAFFRKTSITCAASESFSYESAVEMSRTALPTTLLIIVHRFLLNITSFDHPGGSRTIGAAIGKGNSIELFMQHHRAFVGEQFSKLCIGLVTYE